MSLISSKGSAMQSGVGFGGLFFKFLIALGKEAGLKEGARQSHTAVNGIRRPSQEKSLVHQLRKASRFLCLLFESRGWWRHIDPSIFLNLRSRPVRCSGPFRRAQVKVAAHELLRTDGILGS